MHRAINQNIYHPITTHNENYLEHFPSKWLQTRLPKRADLTGMAITDLCPCAPLGNPSWWNQCQLGLKRNRWRSSQSNEVPNMRRTWSGYMNFPASKVQKGACKNGTPAKGDVCCGPEGVEKGQSLARENQIINEHNAIAPCPGLLFPSRWSSSWTAMCNVRRPLLARPLSLGIIIDAFRFVFRQSCWGSADQAVATKWLI